MTKPYTEMDAGEMYQALGSGAMKWAEAFVQFNPNAGVDTGMMLAWFANAMMAQVDFADGRQPILCGDHAEWLLENGHIESRGG